MSLLRRLLHSLLGLHVPMPGVDPQWSIFWNCALCGEVRRGGLCARRRR